MHSRCSRRRFLLGSGAMLMVPLATRVRAADLPHLDEADPTASALGYRHDTGKVDGGKYPAHQAAQTCAGCSLVQGAAADAWRPCGLFPGKLVAARGWCAAFAAKA
jgi:hypothetical protein